MDNKQWKLSCYSNYSKWQQSPSYLLPHLHVFPPHPLMFFLTGCTNPHAILISIAQRFVLHYGITAQVYSPFGLHFICWSALPGCLPHSVLSRVDN